MPGKARFASRSKYGNKKTVVDGIRFDSRSEAVRWTVLKTMQAAKIISGLQRQVRYKLIVNGQLVTTYVADFVYTDLHGKQVVEDVKGVRTREFIMKAKLLKALHNISVVEIKAK